MVRLCAPDADHVELVVRGHPDAADQRMVAMRQVALGGQRRVWQAPLQRGYYRFVVHRPWGSVEVADPWARAVARRKAFGHEAWAVAGLRPLPPPGRAGRPPGVDIAPRSTAILEVHVRDWTVHPSAGALSPGTYAGAAELHPAAVGGLVDALRMGHDAVEFLPLAAYPFYESPELAGPASATPRASAAPSAAQRVNHWGYMPSFLLAVSERYTQAYAAAPIGSWPGVSGGADGVFADPALELAGLIDALHARGVGVIVDVVWNHVSLADRNPLRMLDPGDWFWREGTELRSRSGCGNDLRTAAPEMRALVLAAVDRWIGELGCDGLRLDLAELLDDETLRQVRARALALRPGAMLIAEPWSLGGYRPREIAGLGYAVWNDRSRDLLRAAQGDRPSLLRGDDGGRLPALRAALEGSAEAAGGWLPDAAHSVTYLECHDGWTLRDLVRLQRGSCQHPRAGGPPRDPAAADDLAAEDLRMLQLAFALLCCVRGPILVHAGQAFGRSRRGADGHSLIENAWDRDDGANHLDWAQRARQPALVRWCAAWLQARRALLAPHFEARRPRRHVLGAPAASLALIFEGAPVSVVLLNLDPSQPATFDLGGGLPPLAVEGAAGSAEGQGPGAAISLGGARWHLPPLAVALLVPAGSEGRLVLPIVQVCE